MLRSFATLVVFAISTTVYAEPVTLLVSVDRATVPADQVQKAVNDLNFTRTDITTGGIDCSVQATVTDYIPYDETAPYYGGALVDLNTACVEKAVRTIEADGRYTVYSNSPITPTPAISGRN